MDQLHTSGPEKWAADYVILKAKILFDTNASQQEVAWLTRPGNDLSNDPQRAQVYLFLLGLGLARTGDTAGEKKALANAITVAKDSDMGQSAAQLLARL